MRYTFLSTPQRFIAAVAISLVGTLVFVARPSQSKAVKPDAQLRAKLNADKFHALVRRGIGAEVSFAGASATREEVRASIDSVTDFISKRSGLELDWEVRQRLVMIEAQALKDNAQRITAEQLTDALNQTLIERIRTLSDAEIEQATETFRGFNSPDLPAAVVPSRRTVKLRANGEWEMAAEKFSEQVKAIRHHLETSALILPILAQTRSVVGKVVEQKLSSLSGAMPEHWGQAKTKGVTPTQAFLVAYSAVSDDYLWYSAAELRGVMKSAEHFRRLRLGVFANADEHYAFGANGYLYSSPLDLFFNERATERLLDRLQERSAR